MGHISGKFADQDSYILTQQIQTSNNNNITLNAAIAENDQVRGSSIAFASQAVTRQPGTLFPTVATTAQNTVSAAIAGIGQSGTASEEEGGGGVPCFIGMTPISTPTGQRPISDIQLTDMVMGFDKSGKLVPQRIIGKQEHLEATYLLVEFEDDSTGTTAGHKYWTRTGYEPIANLEFVWHWNNGWTMRKVTGKRVIRGEVILYNITVANTHNYLANNDAVSNLKPEP